MIIIKNTPYYLYSIPSFAPYNTIQYINLQFPVIIIPIDRNIPKLGFKFVFEFIPISHEPGHEELVRTGDKKAKKKTKILKITPNSNNQRRFLGRAEENDGGRVHMDQRHASGRAEKKWRPNRFHGAVRNGGSSSVDARNAAVMSNSTGDEVRKIIIERVACMPSDLLG
jgi:hypothetical protein